MESVFMNIVNMSITATWIALAVIIFRFIFKKSPKYITVILWGLVAFRLICPYSFESILSLVPSAETIPSDFTITSTPTIESNMPIVDAAATYVIDNMFAPDPTNSINPIQILTFIASIIWVVGMSAMLIYTLISYLKIRNKVRVSVNLQDNIYLCDYIQTPFILGVFKPKIYIPSSVKDEDIQYITAHEKAHLKRLDYLWKPLGFLLLTVYWFNPVLWIAYILLCRDIEFACDEKVIKEMGTEIKTPYSEALINCSVSKKQLLSCPLAFGEVGVKQRIKSVLNYKKPTFWIIISAIILSAVIAICFLTNPKKDEFSKVYPDLDKAISEAILYQNDGKFLPAECISEGHVVFGVEEHSSLVKVYLYEKYNEFGFENGYFMAQSGHSCPAVYIFYKNQDGYSFKEADYPEDGARYDDTIRMMFPKEYVEKALHPSNKDSIDMWDQCKAYAKAYLKEIGRDAEIVRYGEIPHILFTDLGISVDVSNKISELSLPYKSEIGSYEKIEDDIRYIYSTSYLFDEKVILFQKEIHNTKEVVERIQVNAENGDIIGEDFKSGREYYFDAKILEVQSNTVLVEPFKNSNELKSSDKIYVSTDVNSQVPLPVLKSGVNIRIHYDGMIQETYPAQITNVHAIYLYDDINYRGEDVVVNEPTTKSVIIE